MSFAFEGRRLALVGGSVGEAIDVSSFLASPEARCRPDDPSLSSLSSSMGETQASGMICGVANMVAESANGD